LKSYEQDIYTIIRESGSSVEGCRPIYTWQGWGESWMLLRVENPSLIAAVILCHLAKEPESKR
jgi:hypothetical protein